MPSSAGNQSRSTRRTKGKDQEDQRDQRVERGESQREPKPRNLPRKSQKEGVSVKVKISTLWLSQRPINYSTKGFYYTLCFFYLEVLLQVLTKTQPPSAVLSITKTKLNYLLTSSSYITDPITNPQHTDQGKCHPLW